MATLTYFTAIGTYLAAAADSPNDVDGDPDLVPVFGSVKFTPLIGSGSSLQASTLVPPSSLMLRPITAPIVRGQISLNNTTGVRLVANTAPLNLSSVLVYQVDFFDMKAAGEPIDLQSFNFAAPTADTVVDLGTVTRVFPAVSIPGAFIKDPADTADFWFDWTNALPAAVNITAESVTVPSGLTKVSESFTTKVVTVRISGGVTGGVYDINCSITTSTGEVFGFTNKLQVKVRV